MARAVSAADGAINAGADAMSRSREELSDELSNLTDKLSDLSSAWTGEGSVAFTTCIDHWYAGAARIINRLDEFERDLRSSQHAYTATDDAKQEIMSKLSALLG